MRVHELAVPSAALRRWLQEHLPRSEFALQATSDAVLVAEVVDGTGEPVAALVGTHRDNTLSGAELFVAVVATDDAAAVRLLPLLARQLREHGQLELLGPDGAPAALATALAEGTGGAAELVMQQRLLAATSIVPPTDVRGRIRRATRDDRTLVAGWLDEFSVEALRVPPKGPEAWIEQVADAGPLLQLWEADGQPVSLVLARRTTPVSSRIGPVWTPPAHRGNGYAAALTATVAEACLRAGDERVVLLTDVDNPTSNRLYERIGFVEVGPHASWHVRAG